MSQDEIQTRDRILAVSRLLFAEIGFNGTSIREIAKQADVNVSAVNYYFSSKENLYEEVLKKGIADLASGVENLCKTCPEGNLEELSVRVFNHFLSNGVDTVASFKLLMSGPEKMCRLQSNEEIGPPGGKLFKKIIQQRVEKELPEESLHWAVSVIFSHIVHMSIVQVCCINKMDEKLPYKDVQFIEKGIRRLCRSILSDLQEN